MTAWLHLATLLGQAAAVDAPLNPVAAYWRGAVFGAAHFLTLYLAWMRSVSVAAVVFAPFAIVAGLLLASPPSATVLLFIVAGTIVLAALNSVGISAYWTMVYRDLAHPAPAPEPWRQPWEEPF